MFVSMSSIGYGDWAPVTPAGRAVFCVLSLVAAGSLTVFFSVLADSYAARFSESLVEPLVMLYQHG